jgi:hypothetical protein
LESQQQQIDDLLSIIKSQQKQIDKLADLTESMIIG